MIPGPDLVVACSHCGAPARHSSLISGNTFGARVWTDGKQDAPMLPQPPDVVVCGACGRPYWLADAERVGMIPVSGADGVDPAWAAAPHVEEPDEAAHYAAIEGGLARDSDEEKHLRVLAMRKHNDPVRKRWGEEASAASGEVAANLVALAVLLDESDVGERTMKAEVLRELGRFQEAMEVLAGLDDEAFAWVADEIHSLCRRGIPGVKELRPNE